MINNEYIQIIMEERGYKWFNYFREYASGCWVKEIQNKTETTVTYITATPR